MDDDLPVSIPYKCIHTHFKCAICLDVISNALITPCGHRYCKDCIEEIVDRKPQCPCCNQRVAKADLHPDHQLDQFLRDAQKEKEKAMSEYMDSILKRSTSGSGEGAPAGQKLSPFEAVLQKHMKRTLTVHEGSLQSVRLLCQRSSARVENEASREKESLNKAGLPSDELAVRLSQITAKCEDQQRELNKQLEEVTQLLAESFDRYLGEYLPDPSVLPVSVSLTVPAKGLRAVNITLSPTDGCEDVLKMFKKAFADDGSPIARVEDDWRLVLIDPFSGAPDSAASQAAGSAQEQVGIGDGIVMAPSCRPLLQYSVKPNSEIRLLGTVVMESDMPKQCFSVTFNKDNPVAMDYFSCRTCGFNWVCQSCAVCCHKGHDIRPYIMGHEPRWACCYCPKKKKCTL